MKLIKANIPAIEAALAASGKTDKTFFDPELRGFGLRLRASGRQSWICHFERNGKQEKLTIGNAKVLTADEARHKAREILRDADLGRSPRAKRAEEKAKQRITFRHVAEAKNVEFVTGFDARLPKSMVTDAKRLQQIIKNLLSNAF